MSEPGLHVKSGSIDFQCGRQLTLADVAALVESGKLMGIPTDAKVNDIRMSYSGQYWSVYIYWRIEE